MTTNSRKRVSGQTRVSDKNQVTLAVQALREAAIGPGDELRVEASGRGRIVLTQVPSADEAERFLAMLKVTAGALDGVYPPGYLEDLRKNDRGPDW